MYARRRSPLDRLTKTEKILAFLLALSLFCFSLLSFVFFNLRSEYGVVVSDPCLKEKLRAESEQHEKQRLEGILSKLPDGCPKGEGDKVDPHLFALTSQQQKVYCRSDLADFLNVQRRKGIEPSINEQGYTLKYPTTTFVDGYNVIPESERGGAFGFSYEFLRSSVYAYYPHVFRHFFMKNKGPVPVDLVDTYFPKSNFSDEALAQAGKWGDQLVVTVMEREDSGLTTFVENVRTARAKMRDFIKNHRAGESEEVVDRKSLYLVERKNGRLYMGKNSYHEWMPHLPVVPVLELFYRLFPLYWIGATHEEIDLHIEKDEQIIFVIDGSIEVKLFDPSERNNIYPSKVYPRRSIVDLAESKEEINRRYPRVLDAVAFGAKLDRGDAIYVPSYWWHHIKVLDRAVLLFFRFDHPSHSIHYLHSWMEERITDTTSNGGE
mmetsp:Transcript_12653/g.33605  ORF Transcript_12653/g.33605 Transcript_12653/m.33605 type:complete len:435 (-) Transcript_12653:151-1455(-)